MSRTQSGALAGGVVFLLQCFWFRHFQVDDAFITYRYAQNWSAGLGPVMNPGEHVEGVSNLPWTAILALMKVAGLEPHVIAPVLGLLCGLLCVALATRLSVQWSKLQGAQGGGSAGVLLALCAPVAIWSISGLETLLYTSLVTLFLILATDVQWQHRRLRLGILLACVASMRPEGVLLLLAWMFCALVAGTWKLRLPSVLLGFALLATPLLALRLWFYGDWVANTVHAKSSLLPAYWFAGMAYAGKAIVSTLPVWGLAWYGWRSHRRSPVALLALTWVALQLLFMVAVGGERFPGYRFLVPMLPVLIAMALQAPDRSATEHSWIPRSWRLVLGSVGILAGVILAWKPDILLGLAEAVAQHMRLQQGVEQHEGRLLGEVRFLGLALVAWMLTDLTRGIRPLVAIAVAAVWLLLAGFLDDSLRRCRRAGSGAYHGRLVGEWLRQAAPEGTWVATNSAGALPYFSGLPVIDMLGLTDAHISRSSPDQRQWIGHERGDGLYVLQRRPDIIILGGAEGSETPWSFPGDQQIAASEEFHRRYEGQQVRLQGFDFRYYRARDGRMPPVAGSGVSAGQGSLR